MVRVGHRIREERATFAYSKCTSPALNQILLSTPRTILSNHMRRVFRFFIVFHQCVRICLYCTLRALRVSLHITNTFCGGPPDHENRISECGWSNLYYGQVKPVSSVLFSRRQRAVKKKIINLRTSKTRKK